MEENQEFAYTLIRKNVKNINLRVKSDGSVIVSANPRVPQKYIDDFVKSKIAFIEKARTGMEQDRQCPVEQQFITGEKIAYLGGHLILQVKKADSRLVPEWIEEAQKGSIQSFSRNNHGEAVFCKDGCLYLYTANDTDTAYKQQLYDSWQKIQAGILCRQLSRQYYPVFEKLGVIYPEIKIRKMSSRWAPVCQGSIKLRLTACFWKNRWKALHMLLSTNFRILYIQIIPGNFIILWNKSCQTGGTGKLDCDNA